MKIVLTASFEKDYKKLPKQFQEKLDQQLLRLLENSIHPSLRIKKIKGRENIWEGRITKSYRFTFNIIEDAYLIRRAGTHKVLHNP